MRSMQLHFEVIRDKESIFAELIQSQSLGHQMAICFNDEGKLIVKICVVTEITYDNDRTLVTLRSDLVDVTTECVVALDSIESIYPMHAFLK